MGKNGIHVAHVPIQRASPLPPPLLWIINKTIEMINCIINKWSWVVVVNKDNNRLKLIKWSTYRMWLTNNIAIFKKVEAGKVIVT